MHKHATKLLTHFHSVKVHVGLTPTNMRFMRLNSNVGATYSFQWARFLLFLCCVADWMRRESGVKGLKLTNGVCSLLLLSVIDFPEASAFLNRATLRLEDPRPESLALDNKLWKDRFRTRRKKEVLKSRPDLFQ